MFAFFYSNTLYYVSVPSRPQGLGMRYMYRIRGKHLVHSKRIAVIQAYSVFVLMYVCLRTPPYWKGTTCTIIKGCMGSLLFRVKHL